MKRRDLEKHLRQHGCVLNNHAANHDIWVNMINEAKSPIPRHNEVKWKTARVICKQLGVPEIDKR